MVRRRIELLRGTRPAPNPGPLRRVFPLLPVAPPRQLLARPLPRFQGAALMTLELHHVTKRFTGVVAVDNVSFHARAGEITGYLGPNGSGKSTTMKMITGLIQS